MRFEFETAWRALRPGGVLVSHDIVANEAFSHFADAVDGEALQAQGTGLVGVVFKGS
jgi:hypothetical protein